MNMKSIFTNNKFQLSIELKTCKGKEDDASQKTLQTFLYKNHLHALNSISAD